MSGLEGVKKKLSALVFNPGLAEDQEGRDFSVFGFWFIYDDLLRVKTVLIPF